MILVKNWKFLLNIFFFEKGLDMMFKDVPDGNEIFLVFKNVVFLSILKYTQKSIFIKNFVKNLKLLLSLFLFEKDLDMMFT